MKVSLGTVDVSADLRRAINRHYGQPGLATRNDVREYALQQFDAAAADLCYQLDLEEESRNALRDSEASE